MIMTLEKPNNYHNDLSRIVEQAKFCQQMAKSLQFESLLISEREMLTAELSDSISLLVDMIEERHEP